MNDRLVVIWSGEHYAYWRPKASGYVSVIEGAGIYGQSEAEKLTGHCGPEKRIKIIPVRMKTIQIPELIEDGTAPEPPK